MDAQDQRGGARRFRFYRQVLAISALPLFLLMCLGMISGPGAFKGEAFRAVTLGLVNPADAGKLHTVRLPLLLGVPLYLHMTLGLQLLARRLRWLRPPGLWEGIIFAVGALALAQYLLVYLAK